MAGGGWRFALILLPAGHACGMVEPGHISKTALETPSSFKAYAFFT
jgi:hypothetical protein